MYLRITKQLLSAIFGDQQDVVLVLPFRVARTLNVIHVSLLIVELWAVHDGRHFLFLELSDSNSHPGGAGGLPADLMHRSDDDGG
jgi:hypothetical protein